MNCYAALVKLRLNAPFQRSCTRKDEIINFVTVSIWHFYLFANLTPQMKAKMDIKIGSSTQIND